MMMRSERKRIRKCEPSPNALHRFPNGFFELGYSSA